MRSLVNKIGLATLCALASATAVQAQDAPGTSADQKAIEYRQAAFKLMEYNFTPTIGAMLKNQMKFDAALVQKNVARLEAIAPMVPELFAVDTRGKAAGVKTRAREGIWTNNADFKAKNDDFIKALGNLSAVAKSGDEKGFKAAAAAVGKACGACHDSFRDK